MRGGLVILSEKRGGAKLEFVSMISHEMECRKPNAREIKIDNPPEDCVVVTGTGLTKGRRVYITSQFPAALYVIERRLSRLIWEMSDAKRRAEEAVKMLGNLD